MDLLPKLPPGRANRKAKAFCAEIHRLRMAGYTFEGIRLALREAGVEVSRTTVKREAAKWPMQLPVPIGRESFAPGTAGMQPWGSPATVSPHPAVPSPSRSSHEIAEAFFKAHPSNPLLPREKVS